MDHDGVRNMNPPGDKMSALIISEVKQTFKNLGLDDIISNKIKLDDVVRPAPAKRVREEPESSTAPSRPPSSPEAKKLKLDLISAKAQISRLENSATQQYISHREIQIGFETEKGSLEKQHERDASALAIMQDRLQLINTTATNEKDHNEVLVTQHMQDKLVWDEEKMKLNQEIAELRETLFTSNVQNTTTQLELKEDIRNLMQLKQACSNEAQVLKTELLKQTTRAEECIALKTRLEELTGQLQTVNQQLQQLQYVRDSYQQWQRHNRTAEDRLNKMAQLEKDVKTLRGQERNLRECLGNKLLMEEQVNSLQAQVDAFRPIRQELHESKVKLAIIQSSLEEWQALAKKHGAETASAMSTVLDTVLTRELDISVQLAEAQSKLLKQTEELALVKFERNKAAGKENDLLNANKAQESIIQMMKKRQALVTGERDSYSQLLETYEKEAALTTPDASSESRVSTLMSRVERQENVLQGYRDLLISHDPTVHMTEMEKLRAEVTKRRDQAGSLQRELTKARAQRDNLHAGLLRIGDHTLASDVENGNVIPNAEAHNQLQAQLDATQEELERLKASLREESGSGASLEETILLKQQLESSRIKLQRLKEETACAMQKYKNDCYLLTGYDIVSVGNNEYHLLSAYAQSAEEYLSFTVSDNNIEVRNTDYSNSLGDLLKSALVQHRPVPVFLSALTAEMYARSNVQITE